MIHLPMLGVTYAGAAGLDARRNGEPIRLPGSLALGAMLDPALNPWDLVPTRALVGRLDRELGFSSR